ncbi:hypothetical protein Tco_0315860 [Tanacetum coccineum]
MNDMILNKNAKFAAFQKEIDSLKFSLSKNVKDNVSLMTTIDVLKTQSKEKGDKYIEKEIDFKKQIKELENIVFKVGQSAHTMRVITSTRASGSQSKNNTRKNRITPAASSNKKNKTVEVHLRKVMSSSNKRNHVFMCNANFKHAVKGANSNFVCSTCNGCLFSTNHDKCVVSYINDVNKRVKSKSGKSKKMEWKPTGKVFTTIRHRWFPTGTTFTINGTKCPLNRITSNLIVPPKETSQTPVITLNPEVKVYRRRTKVAKSVIQIIFWNDHIAKIIGYGDYQIGNVIISQVYYMEGLGHNLFLVGSRDTNLYTLSLADMM